MKALLQQIRFRAEDLSDTLKVYGLLPVCLILVALVTVVAVAFIYLWRVRRWLVEALCMALFFTGLFVLIWITP
jgi:hypothetical protein